MSDAFLNKMSTKEYNEYHRELFGDDWEDVGENSPKHSKKNKEGKEKED